MGSFALYRGITLASFNSDGKTPCIIERFKICVRGSIKQAYAALTTTAEIESHPGLLTFKFFIILMTSFCMIGIIAMLCGFRCINVVGERVSEGMLLAKFAPVLMKNELKPLATTCLSFVTLSLTRKREHDEAPFFLWIISFRTRHEPFKLHLFSSKPWFVSVARDNSMQHPMQVYQPVICHLWMA